MGIFDLFKKNKKTDDELELESIKTTSSQNSRDKKFMSLDETIPEVTKLLGSGRKMEAVKYVFSSCGIGLKEAKDFVEKIESNPVSFEASSNNAANEISPYDEEKLIEELKNLLASGEKIKAVKLAKDTLNCGLAEAKNYVERFE